MASIRKSLGWVCLVAAALAGPAQAATGTISSSLSTLVVPSGGAVSTVVSWSTSGATKAQVWVTVDDAADTLFAEGLAGSKSTGILPGRAYRFTLYQGKEHTIPLASILVLGVAPSGG